ncbi:MULTISPECIES: CsbD family protein [Streptomyces]|uniref:CsbD family protein n=2 Tax=Streptomyces TaxID=1883 RepID=A0ABU4KF77_9ACTN|nr:CsbD family protein [Streptomyces roseolus]MDX2296382.1 CsbD family protein [Streptomyces roseolus]
MRKSDMQKGKGKIEETVGKATGDRRREAKGKADHAEGTAREAAENVQKVAEKAREAMRRRTA